MWPRICEAVLSLWLLVSPAILAGSSQLTVIARAAAAVMLVLSLLSLIERFRRAYLGTLAVALFIASYPLFQPYPASPMMQNLMMTGLVIAMFAILPPDATQPPRGWRELEQR